jgi:phosphohistidine swiveling domain-containing protein
MALHMMDLREIESGSEAMFGGKACGLAGLIAAGANVPAGFAVAATNAAPDHWAEADREELRRRCSVIIARGPVAVRSSAVGEDSAARSFAGIFETVLGVDDPEAVLTAAARCIASADGARARSYASATAGATEAVGLVIQTQVTARAAGVCFTVDPSGRDSAVLIEAVAGSGDALVSGRAQPHHWRAYRSGLGTWELRGEKDGGPPVLSESDATRIAEHAVYYAERFGHPLDLEWALDGNGELWWLQARPITAAVAPRRYHVARSRACVDDGPVTVWANWNVRETMPEPLMPLTWSIWRDVIQPALVREVFGTPPTSPLFPHLPSLDLINGRAYFNMNGIMAWPAVGTLLTSPLLKLIDREAAEVYAGLVSAGVLRPRRLPGSKGRLLFDAFRANLVSARRFVAALRPRRAMDTLRSFEAAMACRCRDRPLPSLTERELIDEMRLVGGPEFVPIHNGIHDEALAMIVYVAALRAFREHPEAAGSLATGIPENPTTQISLGIDELIDAARPIAHHFREPLPPSNLVARLEAESEGRAWLERWRNFLARFGHRCPREFDLGAPRWIEAPEMIIDLVRAGLQSAAAERLPDKLARLASARRRTVAKAVTAVPWWRRPILRWLAHLVELYMPLREAPKHYAMIAFQRTREAALELGTRLVDRGHIATPSDIFFLELGEIERLIGEPGDDADFRPTITARRKDLERFRAERPPDYLRSDGVPIAAGNGHVHDAEDGLLRGAGVSGGIGRGPVRLLTEPDPKAMADGDVIVMEFADPGWTPLFPRAAAIVMEVGGLMCHAAVVARELGIPAVFGVSGATRALRNGHAVTVDGTRGTVTHVPLESS